jgi:hypothetical protein
MPLDGKLAMNFLLDRSAENWRAEFARLKAEVGECPTAEPLAPTGALSTAFRLNCDRGKLDGTLLLAPTTPATIQAWRLRAVPPDQP